MSFRRSYLPLFRISLLDDGSGLAIPGVLLQPSSRCKHLLANHQLLDRSREYGLDVYYSTNPRVASPLMGPITQATQFDFELHLPRAFYQEYLPDLDQSSGKQLHLQNLDGSGTPLLANTHSVAQGNTVTAVDAVVAQPLRFELQMNIDGAATEFQVTEQFDSTPLPLPGLEIDNTGNDLLVDFDLTSLAAGHYRLATDSQPTQFRHLLLDNALAASGAQGLISIHINQAQDLAPVDGYRFEARFESR